MRPQDLPIRLLAELVFELIDKLPSAERRAFQPKLVELSNLLQDGRKVQWSAERRENHSKVLSEVWSSKRFSEILYLRRNDKITELSGLEAASKALGVKPHSIRCQLSVGRGIATYQRGGSRWVLAKTRELAEEAHLLKFRETGIFSSWVF
jgi:hypothetical protein